MGYVYVILCSDGSYYVGSTKRIENRIKAHKQGNVKYTKTKLPIKLVFVKKFNTYNDAFIFEKRIKSWKKRKSVEKMLMKSDNIAVKYCGMV